MLQLEIYSKVFALQLTLQFFQQYLSKTMFKKFAVLCAAMMFSSSVAAAYELPPVPDSMSDTEIAEFIQSLKSLKPTPAQPLTLICMFLGLRRISIHFLKCYMMLLSQMAIGIITSVTTGFMF